MQTAHIHVKNNDIIAIYINDDPLEKYQYSVPGDCTCTTIDHLPTTITYELVDGVLTAVSQTDIINRMNDPNDNSVVTPT